MKSIANIVNSVYENLVMVKIDRKNEFECVFWDKAGMKFVITDTLLDKFRRLRPDFDKELLKAEFWYLTHPHKKLHFRFLVNWMNGRK